MIYITFGDKYGGIYRSQVIDTISHLNTLFKIKIRLISFVPYTIWSEQKKIIKREYPKTHVFPMIPSRNHWWPLSSLFLLPFLVNRPICIGRGVISANIILFWKKIGLVKRYVYDGRGAIWAEHKEYLSKDNPALINNIYKWEKNSVIKSDFRIAVSSKLLEYWSDTYNYQEDDHQIIPCTFKESQLSSATLKNNSNSPVRIVFSGGSDLWQSRDYMSLILVKILETTPGSELLLLTTAKLEDFPKLTPFANRIQFNWVKPHEVFPILESCDYGILIREKSITNRVASPTKFAEYMYAGLKILISTEIGDFSALVEHHQIGHLISEAEIPVLDKPTLDNKLKIKNLAKNLFSKESFNYAYEKIVDRRSF